MLDNSSLFCLSLKREKYRAQIRKNRNEEIFKSMRTTYTLNNQEETNIIMKYLNNQNDDDQKFSNLDMKIQEKQLCIYEGYIILKWLIDFKDLLKNNVALSIYYWIQGEHKLNLENEYIKKTANILKQKCFTDERALKLTILLSGKQQIRTEFLQKNMAYFSIKELQNIDFIIDLIEINAIELICNLLTEETFTYNLFFNHPEILDYFISQLDTKNEQQYLLDMYDEQTMEELTCSIITSSSLINKLISIEPNETIIGILYNMSIHSQKFHKQITEDLIIYLIKNINIQQFQEGILLIIYSIQQFEFNPFLIQILEKNNKKLEELTLSNNSNICQIATYLLEQLNQ